MKKYLDRIMKIKETTTDLKTRQFMEGLLAFYKRTGKLSEKQIQALEKTWQNQTFS